MKKMLKLRPEERLIISFYEFRRDFDKKTCQGI